MADQWAFLGGLSELRDWIEQNVGGVSTDDPRLSDARTPTAHTHATSEVTGLDTALSGKAASSHSHAQSDVTGLTSALSGKAATSHTHTASQVTDFNSAGDARWAAIGSAGGDTALRLTADQTFTATALANVTGLSFSVASGTLYRFKAHLVYRTAATTTGIRIGATTPASTTYAGNVKINALATDGAGAELQGQLTSSGDSAMTTAVAAANTDYLAVVEGVLLPSANGTFQLQAATEIAASAATVRNGSTLEYRTV